MIEIDDIKKALIDGLSLEDITISDIEDEAPLFGDEGLGLDSVDAIELTLILEEKFGVKITNMADAKSIFASSLSLTSYINEQLKK